MSLLIGHYQTKEELVTAAKALERDFTPDCLKVYSSFSLDKLSDITETVHLPLAKFALLGALIGGPLGYYLQYWISVVAYPLNLSGKPIHSALTFIPITFECTIFGAAISLLIGFFLSLRLPEPYHPLFSSNLFSMARENPFYVVIEARTAPELQRAQNLMGITKPAATDVVEGALV